MRPIDSDALIAQLEADAEQMEDMIAKMFTYAAINDIKHAPTIEPERKTGEWTEKSVITKDEAEKCIEEWQTARCKACGLYHTTPYMYHFRNYNFCPNCGSYNGGEQDG